MLETTLLLNLVLQTILTVFTGSTKNSENLSLRYQSP